MITQEFSMYLKCRLECQKFIIALYRCLRGSEKGLKNSGLNGDSNPDLCDAGAVLHQLSYQANWEQVDVWVDYNQIAKIR